MVCSAMGCSAVCMPSAVTRMPGRAHAACAQALALPCLRRERLLPRAATGSSRPGADIRCPDLATLKQPVGQPFSHP
jgi:hypothetical protein